MGTPFLRATGRHLPYGITQCYLPPDTSECALPNPSHAGWYSIIVPTYPGKMEGWVDLVDLIAPRPGVEPATFRSRVRRRTAAPPRCSSGSHTNTVNVIHTSFWWRACAHCPRPRHRLLRSRCGFSEDYTRRQVVHRVIFSHNSSRFLQSKLHQQPGRKFAGRTRNIPYLKHSTDATITLNTTNTWESLAQEMLQANNFSIAQPVVTNQLDERVLTTDRLIENRRKKLQLTCVWW